MSVQHHVTEPTIATKAQLLQGVNNYISDAVANGRLFVLNGAGKMERVELYMWYQEDADKLLTVVAPSGQTMPAGYEVDEDGEVTRNWAVDS